MLTLRSWQGFQGQTELFLIIVGLTSMTGENRVWIVVAKWLAVQRGWDQV